jgi:fibronectin-binding autotransporter adhesin
VANRFWVGAGTTWDNSTTANWSTTSGGASGASVPGASDTAVFDSHSGSGTITTNYAVSVTGLTLDTGFAGTVTFGATNTFTASGTITLTAGTLNTNGQAVSVGTVSSNNSNTRTLTMGSSAITVTGGGGIVWNFSTTTGLTVTANTAVITCNGNNANVTAPSANWNGSSFSFTGSGGQTVCNMQSATIANLTRKGTALVTDAFTIASNLTVTGTLTLGGGSVQGTNRLLVQSGGAGTTVVVTLTGAAVVINGDVDFMDVTLSGSPSWTNTAGGGSWVGDAGGNTGQTFTVAATQTWAGTSGGNWTANAWTSRVPLPQDDVVISAAFSASQTVTVNLPRLGRSIDWTGATGSPTFSLSVINFSSYGSLTLIAGMSFTGTFTWTFRGRAVFSITSAGQTFPGAATIAGAAGPYTLGDNLSINTGTTFTINGNFNASGKNVSTGGLSLANSNAVVNFGSGTWTLAGTTTILNVAAANTITASTATIVVSDASSTQKTLALGSGFSLPAISYTTAGTGALNLTYTGTTTIASLTVTGAARTLTFQAGQTLTITNPFPASLLAGTGTGAGRMTIDSSDGATQATIKCTSGEFVAKFATIKNNAATGGAQFDAVGQSVSA